MSVPSNLEDLSREELMSLVHSLKRERDGDSAKSTKKKMKIPQAPAPAAGHPPDLTKLKADIRRMTIAAIKKVPHNEKKLPYTEITLYIDEESALALMSGAGPACSVVSDTKQMIKWRFDSCYLDEDGNDVYLGRLIDDWIGCGAGISGVPFNGKVLVFRGGPMPRISAVAGFGELEVRYKRPSNMLILKYRTFMAGLERG